MGRGRGTRDGLGDLGDLCVWRRRRARGLSRAVLVRDEGIERRYWQPFWGGLALELGVVDVVVDNEVCRVVESLNKVFPARRAWSKVRESGSGPRAGWMVVWNWDSGNGEGAQCELVSQLSN